MSSIRLPDSLDLRTMPELGALTLLDAALAIAAQTLRREHADIHGCLDPDTIERSPEAVVAYLLVRSMSDLRNLLGLYADTVRRSPRIATDDIPF